MPSFRVKTQSHSGCLSGSWPSIGRHALLILISVTFLTQTAFAVEWVAHRGASHDAPDNTLAAFRLAWQKNADAIEGDFHLTKDKKIVCLHDRNTKRIAGVALSVADSTLAELRTLDVGSRKGPQFSKERIPTLGEVLATVPAGKKVLIEVKCGPEIVPYLKKELADAKFPTDQTVVIAFNSQVISAVKKEIPQVKALWLTGYKKHKITQKWSPTLAEILTTLKSINADGLDSHAHPLVDADFVKAFRKAGYEFHVWTVNTPDNARRMMDLGVDSITTNRPEFLRQELNN
jgi:glycerophosphoryl diester phosphodiesterase